MKTPISRFDRRSRTAALLLAGVLVAAGCADSSEAEREGAASTADKAKIYTTGLIGQDDPGEPTKGGTLTIAEYSEARSLNPTETYATGTVGGNALAAVYDTLLRYDYESGTWEPKLAESLTTEDDVTWTLTLREGIAFADGTPLDADAVVASMGYYLQNYGFQSTTMLANQTEIERVDDLTVQFTHRQPWASFPAMLAGGPGMIMAPAAYKDPAKFQPIGAGAFELDSYAPTEELVLTAREDYWDGAPALDALRFVWLASDEARMDSFNQGEVDAAFVRTPKVVEDAVEAGAGGMMFVVGGGAQISINQAEGRPGADERVRRAIQLAFDNQTYAERALDGAGLPSKSIFAESSPWYTGVEYPEVDREAASALVEEAKADGWDGEIEYFYVAGPATEAAAVQVKAQLETVGMKVTLDAGQSVADVTERVYIKKDFDLAMGASNVGDPDPYSSLQSVFASTGSTNVTGYSNPEVDKLLGELAANGSDPEAGLATMTKIEEILRDDAAVVMVNPSGNFVSWANNVHGIVPTVQEIVHFDKAWME